MRRSSTLLVDDLLHRAARLRPRAAAVCYRRGDRGVEFLLVRTGAGRWTFPKGCVKPGETDQVAAAREAAEEAGVAGSVEARPFATFRHLKTDPATSRKVEMTVPAFLLEVHGGSAPDERHRAPTWFSPQESKKALAAGRSGRHALGVARVVDEALARLGTA